MATLSSVAAQLDALDDDFSIFSGTPPSKTEIVALEKELAKLGVPSLHPDHRALIAKLGSCAVVAKEAVWPPPAPYETRPAWQFWRGIEIFGLAPKTAPALDADQQSRLRWPGGEKPLVAAMTRLGMKTCIGYDAKGKLYEWEPWGTPTALRDKSLFAILEGWLTTLAEDKDKIKSAPKPVAKKGAGGGAAQWVEKLLNDSTAAATAKKLLAGSAAVRAEVVALLQNGLRQDPDGGGGYVYALGKLAADEKVFDALLSYAQAFEGEWGSAFRILGRHENAKRVVPVLLAALADDDDTKVKVAAEVLVDHAEPSMIPALAKALAAAQKRPRWMFGVTAPHILETLAKAAAKGKPKDVDAVVDILTANLAPKERYAALPAFEALIELGKKANRAVPALEKTAAGKDAYLGSLARHALGAITGDFAPHLDALKQANKSKDTAVKAVAERALAAVGRATRRR